MFLSCGFSDTAVRTQALSEAAAGGGVGGYQGRSRGVRRSPEWALTLDYPVCSAIPLAQFHSPKERADVRSATGLRAHRLPWCSTAPRLAGSQQPLHTQLKGSDITSGLHSLTSVSASQRTLTGIHILTTGRKKSSFNEQKLKSSAANSLLHTFPRHTPISSVCYLDPHQLKF